ncbi:hypothetical protein [Streptomyces sp. LN325]|uniref:hypothetical protein n=1 Tax=Streptomyces sp. LN325 TaxID=3112976 RepID=UPI00371B8E80
MATSGNYAIRSGKHRLYSNTCIYIHDGGRVTDVVTRTYAGTARLSVRSPARRPT